MVLLSGYGKWFLGSRNDGKSKSNLGVHYSIGPFRMASDAVWAKKCPHIYQSLLDNALYGYLKINPESRADSDESSVPVDVFKEGKPETDHRPSVLGRRSYIDDIRVPASSWDDLCQKVERLLEVCDKWNFYRLV